MNEPADQHVTAVSTYLKIFGALMVLTLLTVAAAFGNFGMLNTFIAITIAVIKATLVALFFMHLKDSARIIWVVAGAGVIWMMVMICLTMTDLIGRGWIPYPPAW
jgi:cytochrome c oxidase subunit 4